MARMIKRLVGSAMALTIWTAAAQAHTGHGEVTGFSSGFDHVLGGLDHSVAMLAVGLIAARLGGKALWLVPASFIGMMAIGAILAIYGVSVPFVETGIAASVIAFGLAAVLQLHMSSLVAALFVGAFAVFHGQAHAAEMPAAISALNYGAGFTLATGVLHVVGISLGLGLRRATSFTRRIGVSLSRQV